MNKLGESSRFSRGSSRGISPYDKKMIGSSIRRNQNQMYEAQGRVFKNNPSTSFKSPIVEQYINTKPMSYIPHIDRIRQDERDKQLMFRIRQNKELANSRNTYKE